VLCGISKPPSQAPFITPKTLLPTVVATNPISKTALNGLFPSHSSSPIQ